MVFKKITKLFGGDPQQRKISTLKEIVDQINDLESSYEALSDDALRDMTNKFRNRLDNGEVLDDLLVEAFATVREVSKRTLGQRPYDVQLITGITLHRGEIAEMKTGEGKTLAATLPLYLNALTRRPVHLVTVNDYLARRDGRWMGKIFDFLGLKVGILQAAARTDSAKKGFVYDPKQPSTAEINDMLRLVNRKESYQADVVYGTNNEFGFDYLRDNLAIKLENRVQRGHAFAIIDEVDSVLIDSARTPLIISGPAYDDTERYQEMNAVVVSLQPEDYEINEKDRTVALTEIGIVHAESLLNRLLRNPDDPESFTYEQARDLGFLEQALRAHFLFHRNKDYVVQRNSVIIVDQFTGRMMEGRRWSDGLHQAVEAKENVNIQSENVTHATITIQNYFRMYEKLAGMTGTAITEAEEFFRIYGLEVLQIPTNLNYQTLLDPPVYIKDQARDEEGYSYQYYYLPDDSSKTPIFWERQDYPDIIYRTKEAKLRAIVWEIIQLHVIGRPQLVGTASVESSEELSSRLKASQIRRLMEVSLIRNAYKRYHGIQEEAFVSISGLEEIYQPLEDLDSSKLRQLGRQVDLSSLSLLNDANMGDLLQMMQLTPDDRERLESVLKAGVPHQVLNARHHTEESNIIAGAGGFGAVTIATNMAGRGVDIKLGGELPEALIENINRVLRNAKYSGVFQPDFAKWAVELERLLVIENGIQVRFLEDAEQFVRKIDEMKKVRRLGGLHVIGTERHEARRIDNQLRGRAARQGDPGSSRFFLSTEDDLMRLFGGVQLEATLSRMRIDEATPIESGLIGRIVEQAQKRVEGANFDVRKHLLEYDDVLNTHRERIYAQRDRVFEKEDLREDVTEMFEKELRNRINAYLDMEGQYWRLLAYLDYIQPTINAKGNIYPSYTKKLLIEHLGEFESPDEIRGKLLGLASDSLSSWYAHNALVIDEMLTNTRERFEQQISQKLEGVDILLENLDYDQPNAKQALTQQLTGIIGVHLPLSDADWTQRKDDVFSFSEGIRKRIRQTLRKITIRRLVMTIEQRVGDELDLDKDNMVNLDWSELDEHLCQWLRSMYDQRVQRLTGEGGEIARDFDRNREVFKKAGHDQSALLMLLDLMTQGRILTFDKRTKKRTQKRVHRLTYLYLAADLLKEKNGDAEIIANDIMKHLSVGQDHFGRLLGQREFEQMRVGDHKLGLLPIEGQEKLIMNICNEHFERIKDISLNQFEEEDRDQLIAVLGLNAQNRFYRYLLLSTISQLWRDYLTEVEGLRVAVKMEAYGQRDPLVAYKSRASQLFSDLLANIRSNVVQHMFHVRLINDEDLRKIRPGLQMGASEDQSSRKAGATSGKRKKKSRKRH